MNKCKECSNETKNPNFCSHSCSAIYNNKIRLKKEKPKCKNCNFDLSRKNGKFCSSKCQAEFLKKSIIENFIQGKNTSFLGKTIRNFLLASNNYKCSKCGWGEKNTYNQIIYLDIHHIDGNRKNNKINNLQVLCQNCHSLTATFRHLNK